MFSHPFFTTRTTCLPRPNSTVPADMASRAGNEHETSLGTPGPPLCPPILQPDPASLSQLV